MGLQPYVKQLRPRNESYVPHVDKVQTTIKEVKNSEVEAVIKAVGGGKLSEAVFETWVYNVARLSGNKTTPTSADIDKILSNSLAGKSIKTFLNKEVEKNSIFFKKKEKELKDKEKSIISQKNIIKEDEYNIKIENFKKEVSDYNLLELDYFLIVRF